MKQYKPNSKNHWILAISLVLLTVACGNTTTSSEAGSELSETSPEALPQAKEQKASIRGTFEGASERPVYLQYLTATEMKNMDTVLTNDKGAFEFELSLVSAGYYRVGLNENNMCVLIVKPKDKVKVTAKAEDIYSTYEVENSEESQRLKDLNALLVPRDSINMALQNAQMMRDQAKFQEVLAVYDPVLANVNDEVKAFIDEDPATLSALAAVQNLNIEQDYAYFTKVIDALESEVSENEFYQAMRAQVNAQRKLAIGSPAPEIALPQANGDELKLSDLKGQYVLIDFWASWCGPCRKENPNVVRVYNKYHDQGFEILGVSLDKNQKSWLNAIEQDGLKWRHVSDLKYWGSEVVPEYQIKGIPLTYLVDPEGNIIGKNLRGQSLENKLAQIFEN